MSHPPLSQIIYVSAAVRPFSAQELATLLLRARTNNARLGITGLLIHHQSSFFQVLEGGPSSVATLFQRISRDDRHHRLFVIDRCSPQVRSFEGWSMGFVDGAGAALSGLPGYNDVLRNGALGAGASSSTRARDLALAFRDGRLRQFIQSG